MELSLVSFILDFLLTGESRATLSSNLMPILYNPPTRNPKIPRALRNEHDSASLRHGKCVVNGKIECVVDQELEWWPTGEMLIQSDDHRPIAPSSMASNVGCMAINHSAASSGWKPPTYDELLVDGNHSNPSQLIAAHLYAILFLKVTSGQNASVYMHAARECPFIMVVSSTLTSPRPYPQSQMKGWTDA